MKRSTKTTQMFFLKSKRYICRCLTKVVMVKWVQYFCLLIFVNRNISVLEISVWTIISAIERSGPFRIYSHVLQMKLSSRKVFSLDTIKKSYFHQLNIFIWSRQKFRLSRRSISDLSNYSRKFHLKKTSHQLLQNLYYNYIDQYNN